METLQEVLVGPMIVVPIVGQHGTQDLGAEQRDGDGEQGTELVTRLGLGLAERATDVGHDAVVVLADVHPGLVLGEGLDLLADAIGDGLAELLDFLLRVADVLGSDLRALLDQGRGGGLVGRGVHGVTS